MFNKKTMLVLPLIALTIGLSACGPTSEDTSINVPTFEPSVYDSSWQPGENALKGAQQPAIKNPIGQESVLNQMRRTQNSTGLPSLGNANILIVPLTFKDDNKLEQTYRVNLGFSQSELSAIETVFFDSYDDFDYLPSVKRYYEISSYDKFSLDGAISPVIEYPYSFSDVILKIRNTSLQTVSAEIVDYIYNYLFEETQTYYIGDFDADKDGRVDALSLMTSFPYGNIFGEDTQESEILLDFIGTENYGFTKDLANPNKTLVNSYFFTTNYFRHFDASKYGSHIYVNAVGKLLGLDSYLDTTPNPTTGQIRSVFGLKDMMEGAIGDHNSFSKYQLGWIEPKIISPNSLGNEKFEITLTDFTTSGNAVLLHTGKHSEFGEYLLIEMYYPTSMLNKSNTTVLGPYGSCNFTTRGVKVTKVNSSLVRGYSGLYNEFDGETNFNDYVVLPNGKIERYVYDYAFTACSVNKYYDSGITANYPLVSLLSKYGLNRHLVDASVGLNNSDLFKESDVFGEIDDIDGFYKNFRFDGKGADRPLLNINFKVKEFINNKAILEFWRVD